MKWLKATAFCALGAGTYLKLPEVLIALFGPAGAIAMIPGAGITVALIGWFVSTLSKG